MDYKRVAIVTGATSGIGEATAKRFLEAGYAVIGTGRNRNKFEELEHTLGSAFCGLCGEGSDDPLLEALFSLAETRYGKPADIIVANAGQGLGGSVSEVDLQQFKTILDINVTGTLALLQKAALRLKALQCDFPNRAADIVVIGSTVGRNISPFSAAYGATKFAAHALTEGLRRELGPQGVRVSLVEPAIVLSGFQEGAGYSDEMVATFKSKFGPLLYGQDIAEAIYFIVSQPAHIHISDLVVRPTRQDYP